MPAVLALGAAKAAPNPGENNAAPKAVNRLCKEPEAFDFLQRWLSRKGGGYTLKAKIKHFLASFVRNISGSEAIEMVTTTAMITSFVIIAFMFFTYVFEVNMCAYATRQVVHDIEVSGQVNQTQIENTFNSILGGSGSLYNKEIRVTKADYIAGTKNIQVKNRYGNLGVFTVVGSCTYRLQLINPGRFDGFYIEFPIQTEQRGMSEVYWTEKSGGTVRSNH